MDKVFMAIFNVRLFLVILCFNSLPVPATLDDRDAKQDESTTENDVVLIIGGRDGSLYYGPPEIYTGHLGEDYRLCLGSDVPTVNPPFNNTWASSGFYVPDIGIYICGGEKYNLTVSELEQRYQDCAYISRADKTWTHLALPLEVRGGLVMPHLLPLAQGENAGFLLAGGQYEGGSLKQSYKYQPSENLKANWTEFIIFPQTVFRRNSATMRINHISNLDHLIYVIRNAYSITTCLCNQTLDDVDCPDENWICVDHPTDLLSTDATTTIRKNVEGVEMDAILLLNFLVEEQCFLLTVKSWDFTANSPVLTLDPITGPRVKHGALITLNGIATFFGGVGSGEPSKEVLQYDPDADRWTQLETSMVYPREYGTTVIVHESWFCNSASQPTTEQTTSPISTENTSSFPHKGNCTKLDSRGILWTANYGETIYKDCPEGYDARNGSAIWYCDGFRGDFYPDEPDRSSCIADWLQDIQNMIDSEVSPEQISEAIAIELNKGDSRSTTGGSIVEVNNVIETLLTIHSHTRKDAFTENIINATDIIFLSSLGWKEISDEGIKNELVSDYLNHLDYAGYLWAEDMIKESECTIEKIFKAESVSLITKTVINTVEEFMCFYFGSSGSICYPGAELDKGCNVLVATTIKSKGEAIIEDSSIFPTVQEFNTKGLLGQTLIGLTINNNNRSLTVAEAEASIIFKHEDLYTGSERCLLVPRSPTCIFWNTETSSWSPEGCEVISSSTEETVCSCNHLTNFGIVLDWEGKAPANDHALETTSLVLLICSCVAVLLTELLLSLQKKDSRQPLQKLAERNRNFSLFCAQLLFLVLVGQFRRVNCTICEVFGAMTHLFWLNFFFWTVVEGYCFYTALVTVFEKSRTCLWKYFFLGYGIPSVIVLITVIISLITNSYLYLRRDLEGRVNSCWLHGQAMFSILIPVGIVVIMNILITGIAVVVSYKNSRRSRSAVFKDKIILAMKNTLLLSFFFGSTWIVGFLPYSRVQQFATVILNASLGFYILYYSVLSNSHVIDNLKSRFTSSRQQDQTRETETNYSNADQLSYQVPAKSYNNVRAKQK